MVSSRLALQPLFELARFRPSPQPRVVERQAPHHASRNEPARTAGLPPSLLALAVAAGACRASRMAASPEHSVYTGPENAFRRVRVCPARVQDQMKAKEVRATGHPARSRSLRRSPTTRLAQSSRSVVGLDAPQPVVTRVGDEDTARAVDGNPDRGSKARTRTRSAISGVPRLPVPGDPPDRS